MDQVLDVLPEQLKKQVLRLAEGHLDEIEEIRIRCNRPLELAYGRQVIFGKETVCSEDTEQFLNRISQFSFYMLDEQFRRGYITIAGGHRIGLAGKVVLENGHVKGLREISSFNIRIARQKLGVAEQLISFLYSGNWQSTLIVGPPQTGKTTLLRDLARIISEGKEAKSIFPRKVGIVDERSELAGCVNGVPQMYFGHRVDVLDGCPKSEGMMMLIRSMSPEVLIVDEIGRKEDVPAVIDAVNAGVCLCISIHGENYQELLKRPIVKEILQEGNFQRIVELQRRNSSAMIYQIYDGQGRKLDLKSIS